ncbi:MAG: transporter substrate-binding domain-containing protein [Rhodospirillales bacterium]|nr:transporter substrate-binding domain-containing protein [Rhodospirillales bacterium]
MVKRWTCLRRLGVSLFVVLSVFGAPPSALSAEDSIHLISAEISGGLLEKRGNEVVGAYADFFREASARSGVPIDFRIVPWARAIKETERSDNMLLFPFTRTAERENRFNWITPLKEDPMCFASVGAKIDSLEDARKLKRILVWRGASHLAYLKKLGFENLIVVGKTAKVMQILKASPDAAWYWVCDQAQLLLDKGEFNVPFKIGAPVASEAVWLVGSKSFAPAPQFNKFVQAIEALRGEKLMEKLLAAIAK